MREGDGDLSLMIAVLTGILAATACWIAWTVAEKGRAPWWAIALYWFGVTVYWVLRGVGV